MEDKRIFVKKLEELLKLDQRRDIKEMCYQGTKEKETVHIVFKGGLEVDVDVTADSLAALLEDVLREVRKYDWLL